MDDWEEVADLFNLYRTFYEQISDLDSAREFIKERIKNKDSVIFAAKNKGNYIGFTQLYPSFSSISMKKIWILNDLYVDELAREQGVGRMLLQKVNDFAIETNVMDVHLITATNNYPAQRLYEKFGYKKDTGFYRYKLSIR